MAVDHPDDASLGGEGGGERGPAVVEPAGLGGARPGVVRRGPAVARVREHVVAVGRELAGGAGHLVGRADERLEDVEGGTAAAQLGPGGDVLEHRPERTFGGGDLDRVGRPAVGGDRDAPVVAVAVEVEAVAVPADDPQVDGAVQAARLGLRRDVVEHEVAVAGLGPGDPADAGLGDQRGPWLQGAEREPAAVLGDRADHALGVGVRDADARLHELDDVGDPHGAVVQVEGAVDPPGGVDRVLDLGHVECSGRGRRGVRLGDDVRHPDGEREGGHHAARDHPLPPALPGGRGHHAIHRRSRDVDRRRGRVAGRVERDQVEGVGGLGQPAADLRARHAEHLGHLVLVELAEVVQHDGDAGRLVELVQAGDDPLEQRQLVLQLLREQAGRGHGHRDARRRLLPADAHPAVEHHPGELDVDVDLAPQPAPVGHQPRERRHRDVLGPFDRLTEHHEHPDHRPPARDDVRREVRVRSHVPILPRPPRGVGSPARSAGCPIPRVPPRRCTPRGCT